MLKSTRILELWALVIDSITKYSNSIILKVVYSKLVYSTPALVRIYSDIGDLWFFQVVVFFACVQHCIFSIGKGNKGCCNKQVGSCNKMF